MTLQTISGNGALIVGIDIGGTKTHLRAEAAGIQDAAPARDKIVPSAQWRTRSWDGDARRLLDMVAEFAGGSPVAAIGVGAHGCDDESECNAFSQAFAALTDVPVTVVNDAELMPLALGMTGQIGVVAGTGSIAVCRPVGGAMMSAGGWGWVVGDEGSAAGLVREAVRAVARHFDAGGLRDEPLAEALLHTLGVPAPRLGSAVAALGGPAAVGAHAEAVFAAAASGSELARRVIREGGASLAELVLHLEARGAGVRHVVAGGSVIVAQPSLWQAFSEAVSEGSSARITPHLFSGSPVEGACRLAAAVAHSSSGEMGSPALYAAPN
jgi:glucosamine kinase